MKLLEIFSMSSFLQITSFAKKKKLGQTTVTAGPSFMKLPYVRCVNYGQNGIGVLNRLVSCL